MPEYMSPSSLKSFEKDRDHYYLSYMVPDKIKRMPQTQPMSIGSAFDAFVKSYLHFALFGNYGNYEQRKLFEEQVEEANWDWAWPNAERLFDLYKKCGALADLMLELNSSVSEPRFEFTIHGFVDSEICTIPLLGKPDIFFINSEGARVILDWKVNGYCGKNDRAPTPGYVFSRDTWTGQQSRSHLTAHKDAYVEYKMGIKCNCVPLEEYESIWADQLCTYAWLLGVPIGSTNLIIGIDQLAGSKKIRVSSYRGHVSSDYQFDLLGRYATAWECVNSDHFFKELSKEANDAKIKNLIQRAENLTDGSDFSDFMSGVSW